MLEHGPVLIAFLDGMPAADAAAVVQTLNDVGLKTASLSQRSRLAFFATADNGNVTEQLRQSTGMASGACCIVIIDMLDASSCYIGPEVTSGLSTDVLRSFLSSYTHGALQSRQLAVQPSAEADGTCNVRTEPQQGSSWRRAGREQLTELIRSCSSTFSEWPCIRDTADLIMQLQRGLSTSLSGDFGWSLCFRPSFIAALVCCTCAAYVWHVCYVHAACTHAARMLHVCCMCAAHMLHVSCMCAACMLRACCVHAACMLHTCRMSAAFIWYLRECVLHVNSHKCCIHIASIVHVLVYMLHACCIYLSCMHAYVSFMCVRCICDASMLHVCMVRVWCTCACVRACMRACVRACVCCVCCVCVMVHACMRVCSGVCCMHLACTYAVRMAVCMAVCALHVWRLRERRIANCVDICCMHAAWYLYVLHWCCFWQLHMCCTVLHLCYTSCVFVAWMYV